MRDFIGFAEAAVDEKGRLAVPFRFRRLLYPDDQETFILTLGFDGELMAFPKDVWRQLRERIEALEFANPFDPRQRKYLRRFLHESEECRLDPQGRILLPSHLREKLALNGRAVVAGSSNRLEIWNPNAYTEVRKRDDDEAVTIANAISLAPRPRPPEM
jgi:MraZ protein